MKRTAVIEGEVLSVGRERSGSPVVVAHLDFTQGGGRPSAPGSPPAPQPNNIDIDLNATNIYVSDHGAGISLRAADLSWLGRKCRLTITVEVL